MPPEKRKHLRTWSMHSHAPMGCGGQARPRGRGLGTNGAASPLQPRWGRGEISMPPTRPTAGAWTSFHLTCQQASSLRQPLSAASAPHKGSGEKVWRSGSLVMEKWIAQGVSRAKGSTSKEQRRRVVWISEYLGASSGMWKHGHECMVLLARSAFSDWRCRYLEVVI